jgi:hypothetical protein
MEFAIPIISAIISGIFTIIAALINRPGKSRKTKKRSSLRIIFTFIILFVVVYLLISGWDFIKFLLALLLASLLS